MRMHWRLLVTGLAISVAACTSLIGINDIFYADGASPGSEGGVDGAGPTTEGGGPIGDGGSTDGNTNPCGADLDTDKKNCGKCGHDCSNGMCAGGLCTLGEQLASPQAITVHGSAVFMGLLGGDGQIASCATNGCDSASVGKKNLSSDAGPYPWRVAANDQYVFSSDFSGSNQGGVWRALVNGSGITKLPPEVLDRSYGIALDATTVYWITDGSPGNLQYCAFASCTAPLTAVASVPDGELLAVASDGKLVWVDNQGSRLMWCANKGACTPQLLVPTFQGRVEDMTIDGNTVYWGTNYGEVLSCATSGCANPTKIFKEDPSAIVAALAVSGTSLYFSTEPYGPDGNSVIDTDGLVKSCTLPACKDVKVIAKQQHDPSAMALDAKSVYWANSGKRGFVDGIGTLMKAPR